MNDKNTWYAWIAVAFVLGLILGFLAHWLIIQPASAPADSSLSDTASTSMAMNQVEGDNGLIVADQQAGAAVAVQQVVLQEPGWVSIQDDVNGQPGRILGAALFDKGTNAGSVALLRKTVPGTSY